TPAEAQAQITLPGIGTFGNILGPGGLAALNPLAGLSLGPSTTGLGLGALTGLFTGIPFFNLFVGNGADGTALSPNGQPGGIFARNGGNGFNQTGNNPLEVQRDGGNGGNAGFFFGSGGKGGNGAPGTATLPGGNGGKGGNASFFVGSGGDGGAGGNGA